MEEDINIYADLPSFTLTESNINDQPKADHTCKCEELENKFSSLTREFENMEKINENLEKNLASLLKTAKAEIVRKDKMIEELRNKLDNVAFRRNENGSRGFSTLGSLHHHNTIAEKYENVTPLMNLEEDAFMSQQIEPNYTEYKNKKPQNNIDEVPVTVFGERLHKRIMDDKKEEKRLRTSSKLSSETNVKIPEECIVESDKENGSQSSINNANESNAVTRSSNSGTSYKRNSGKRLNEEDDICKIKRLKTENNEDRNDDDINCNSMAQYNTKDNLTKLEDQLCVMYSIKKEQVPLETKRRATSEYGDTRETQNCRNEWRKEERTSATKDYDNTRTRKGSVDNSRSRSALTSNERLNNDYQHDYYTDYRKNDYRYGSSSSRSFLKSRSDYESSSSHRLWEKSSRAYRDRKYDDYKYDSRYKNDRTRRGYDSKETSGVRTRYNSRERIDLRDRLRYTTSDVEERRSRSGSYKNNKYDNYRLKETMANVSEDKRSHKSSKTVIEIDPRVSSSRTVINTTMDHSVGKSTEQHSAKNELHAPVSSAENTSTCATPKNQSYLEEGEILSSPNSDLKEKKNDSMVQTMEENIAKSSIQVEDASGNAPVIIQENVENISHVKNDLTQLDPAGECTSMATETCFRDFVMDDLHSDKIITYPSFPSPGIIEGCNNNCDGDYECENCVDENVENAIVNRPVEEMYDSNNESIVKNKEVDNANAESITEVDKVTTMLNLASSLPPNDNSIRQTDREDVVSFTSDEVTQLETVPNCDKVDGSRVFSENETSHQIRDNNNAEVSHTCLNDHNYVRDTVIDASNLNAVPSISERHESVSDTATLKKTEVEEMVNIQSVDCKKTTSTVKSKKDQNSKAVVISRRRKAVILSDNNASMTVMINTDSAGSSLVVDNSANDKSDTVSKPRACKLARTIKSICK